VFVSSTFSDLAAYRAGVRAAIRRLGATDVAMEDFGSRDDRPLKECVRIIRSETDWFVGIYAHRYGFVPDGRQSSITAAEYQAARTAGLPVLAYLVAENARWPSARIEKGAGARRLHAFKTMLTRHHIVSFFSTKDELAGMIAADLGRHIALAARRVQTVAKLSGEAQERERRLLATLRSAEGPERSRAAAALRNLGSRSATSLLTQLMLGGDEALAQEAARALEQSGSIAGGLLSPHARVRWWALFRVGENALRDHEWGLGQVPPIVALLERKSEPVDCADQAVHTLAKIGGPAALKALARVLRDPGMPPAVKATALEGPPRFWSDGMFASSASEAMIPAFIDTAIDAIRHWPPAVRSAVTRSERFEYTAAPLQDTVRAASPLPRQVSRRR
jgi:HEAT repeat protein